MCKVRQYFLCLEDYLKKHNVPVGNIIAVVTDDAPVTAGCYREFATLLKEMISNECTIYCVLPRHHLVAKKFTGELHDAAPSNKIKVRPPPHLNS